MVNTSNKTKEISGFRLVAGYIGMFLVLIGIISAIPLLVIPFHQSDLPALPIFGGVSGANIVLGLLLYFVFIFKRKRSRLVRRQESLLLLLAWIAAIVSGAAPFYIATLMGKMNMGVAQSIFESTSGYSTTGLTVFSGYIDVEGAFCPYVYTFHRALTNFIGGVGLVLLIASLLGAGGGGMSLYVSEGHSDRILPNVAHTAKLIFGIYLFYTLIGIVALTIAGMPVFDAICHSMSALSGGGFSPRADNIAAYRSLEGLVLPGGVTPVCSLAIEIIMMVLVVLSAISFMSHTFLLRGRFGRFFRDDEIRFGLLSFFFAIVIGLIPVLVATAASGVSFWEDAAEALRCDLFYVIGCMTNSGFASTSADGTRFLYHIIPGGSGGQLFMGHTFVFILIILMLVGGGAGSTAGGIKQYRVALCFRNLQYSIRYRFASIHQHYPRVTNRYGQRNQLEDSEVGEAYRYMLLFVLLFLVLTGALCMIEPNLFSVESAAFDVASAISNTGLSWIVGPTYGALGTAPSLAVLWLLSVGMLLGRLEVYPAAYAIASIGLETRYHIETRRRRKREAAFEINEGE